MKSVSKTLVGILVLGAATLMLAAPSFARYPSRAIKLIVGFPPGGGNDVVGRLYAKHLSKVLGQTVIVENKTGADGAIAAHYVATAKPDGYTLLSGSSGMMAYDPGLHPHLSYNPMKDFDPITMVGYSQIVFSVNPKLPVHTLKGLVAYSKAHPHKLFYASPAAPHHVAFEDFKALTGADIQAVPYRGSGPAIMAVIEGQEKVLVSSVYAVLQPKRAGTLRPLAVAGAKRSEFLPDVPTAIESGVNFQDAAWIGLYAPRGTPRAIRERLYRAVREVENQESFKKSMAKFGYEQYAPMTTAQFTAFQRQQQTHWTRVIKKLHLELNG